MTQPTAYRPKKPGRSAIEAQVEKLCCHAYLQGEKRGELLRYLVRIQREGRYRQPFDRQRPTPTGKRILFEFYKEWAHNNAERDQWPTPDDSEEAGKKLIGELAEALERYYEFSHDEIVVRIRRGRGEGYEPQIEWRIESAGPVQVFPALPSGTSDMADGENPVREQIDCCLLGNSNDAVDYVIRRFRQGPKEQPRLVAFRDTHIRPRREIANHVNYVGLESALLEFLRESDDESTVATMILGWDIDRKYVRAMVNAAARQGDKFKCFRLHAPALLLNFLLLDYSDLTSEVLFGGGQGRPGPPGKVFRSKDPRLVDEFNALYHELLNLSERLTIRGSRDWSEEDAAQPPRMLTLEGR